MVLSASSCSSSSLSPALSAWPVLDSNSSSSTPYDKHRRIYATTSRIHTSPQAIEGWGQKLETTEPEERGKKTARNRWWLGIDRGNRNTCATEYGSEAFFESVARLCLYTLESVWKGHFVDEVNCRSAHVYRRGAKFKCRLIWLGIPRLTASMLFQFPWLIYYVRPSDLLC